MEKKNLYRRNLSMDISLCKIYCFVLKINETFIIKPKPPYHGW